MLGLIYGRVLSGFPWVLPTLVSVSPRTEDVGAALLRARFVKKAWHPGLVMLVSHLPVSDKCDT